MNTEINAGASSSTGPPTKFAIRYNQNIKRPEELKKFKSDPHETTEIDILKNRYYFLHIERNSQLSQLDLLENKKDKTEMEIKVFKRATKRLIKVESELTDIWQRLEELTKRKSIEDDTIHMPKFGKNSDIDFTGVQGIPTFDPKSPSPTLYQVWELICEFSTNFGLTEKAMKTILSQKLKHEALDLFMLFKNYPLSKIITCLKNRFGSFPTLFDYEAEYESFKRRKEEDISTAMARFETILRKLHQQQSPEEIKQIIERDCKAMVKKCALPEARAQLEREEEKAKIKGCFFSYKDRLDTVLLEENLIRRKRTPTINMGVIEDYEEEYRTPEEYQEEHYQEQNYEEDRSPVEYNHEAQYSPVMEYQTAHPYQYNDTGPINEIPEDQDPEHQLHDNIPEEPEPGLFSIIYNNESSDDEEEPPSASIINILKLNE